MLCPDCGQTTQAQLPDEAQGQFGPELTALLAYLTVVCRMPRRVVLEPLGQVLGIPLSLGSAQKAVEHRFPPQLPFQFFARLGHRGKKQARR